MREVCFALCMIALAALYPKAGMAAEVAHGAVHHEKNHFALFLGMTQAEEHDGAREDQDPTIGVDYERRLNEVLGVVIGHGW